MSNIVKFLEDKYHLTKERLVRHKNADGGIQVKNGKWGRDSLLHKQVLAETLELADKECPQAADTIRVLLWNHCRDSLNSYQVVEHLLKTEQQFPEG